MEFQQNIDEVINNLTESVDFNFIQTKIMPKITKNINESKYVTNDVKKKFMTGGVDKSKRLRLSNLKGGCDTVAKDALEVIVSHYLSDINKYDAKLLNILSDKGYEKELMIKFLIINNVDDIQNTCGTNNMGNELCSMIINLKKMSTLYKIKSQYNI